MVHAINRELVFFAIMTGLLPPHFTNKTAVLFSVPILNES
jgi:hypothetical protein